MSVSRILNYALYLYVLLYALIYFIYIFYINAVHASISLMSISAMLLPFVLLLFFQWISWKYTDQHNKRKIKIRFIVISILGFSLLFYCVFLLGVNENESRFTTERWLNDDEGRVYLVDDLMNEHELIGMTKEEVITLLGSPTETEYFKEKDNVVYFLGAERGLIRIDSEWLVIWFDGRDKAVKYELRTD
ncbi:outer membrane protein assembly factor BamE [Peribacillus sp. NJ11]|uniref:outer membrane protein assembly factor BamE domain-containing protein n=1 Tax=Peribacillus sp. NJ11 TaxID=3055861 RepID=UPI0025A1EE23|nr:outer membrane protein assembly factor BamE [Peribacillus sp. NJ11]MDM5221651.1 outer membrane protein assembly factor BamE [Peribacillus sp. NJ11]